MQYITPTIFKTPAPVHSPQTATVAMDVATAADAATRRLHAAQRDRAAAERAAAGCKEPGSVWHKRHTDDAQNARNRAAAEQQLLDALHLQPQAELARKSVTDLPLARFFVRDANRPPNGAGRFPAVVCQRVCNEARIAFFGAAAFDASALVPGARRYVTLPGCRTCEVEVL